MAKTKQQPITTRMPPVIIVYDHGTKGQRRTKEFEDANEAKKFFAAKDKAGKKPTVQKAKDEDEDTTTGTAAGNGHVRAENRHRSCP